VTVSDPCVAPLAPSNGTKIGHFRQKSEVNLGEKRRRFVPSFSSGFFHAIGPTSMIFAGVVMAPLGPPKVMKVRGGKSPRLKPGVKTAPLTPGFSPGLLG
jgi:hypothetical protein